jgi:hypothetical protein
MREELLTGARSYALRITRYALSSANIRIKDHTRYRLDRHRPMLFENPFFTREVRARVRKAWAPLCWMLLLSALAPLSGMWVGARQWSLIAGASPVEIRGLLLVVATGLHAAVCGVAGWGLGATVFGREHQENTLESLRLITASPWVWTLQKLVFPLYALLVVWLAAAPSYLALSMRGHALPSTLWTGMLLAGSVGFLTFGAALVAPPERIGLPLAAERVLPLAQRLELQSVRMISLLLGWEVLALGAEWIGAGAYDHAVRFQIHPLFGVLNLRADQYFLGLLALFLGCALACAWASADPASAAARRLRLVARRFTAAVAYLLLIGLTWQGAHWLWQTLLIGFPAVQLLRVRAELRRARVKGRTRRSEDRRAAGEIAAVQRVSDNPVLLRDLRVALRGAGMRAGFLTQCGIILALGLCVVLLLNSGFWGTSARLPRYYFASLLSGLYWWGWAVVLLRTSVQGAAQWAAERRMRTVPQLLLSPIRGRDLVLGRWLAALLPGLVALLPWALAQGVCGLLVDQRFSPSNWTLITNLWEASMAGVLSLGMAGAIREPSTRRLWLYFAGGPTALVVAEILLLFWSFTWRITWSSSDLTITNLCLCMALVNAGLLPFLVLLESRCIEAQRRRLFE